MVLRLYQVLETKKALSDKDGAFFISIPLQSGKVLKFCTTFLYKGLKMMFQSP
jgi:hypothetical protein